MQRQYIHLQDLCAVCRGQNQNWHSWPVLTGPEFFTCNSYLALQLTMNICSTQGLHANDCSSQNHYFSGVSFLSRKGSNADEVQLFVSISGWQGTCKNIHIWVVSFLPWFLMSAVISKEAISNKRDVSLAGVLSREMNIFIPPWISGTRCGKRFSFCSHVCLTIQSTSSLQVCQSVCTEKSYLYNIYI